MVLNQALVLESKARGVPGSFAALAAAGPHRPPAP
jgi:hypothetical protein